MLNLPRPAAIPHVMILCLPAKTTTTCVSTILLVPTNACVLTIHAQQLVRGSENFFQGFSETTTTKKSRTDAYQLLIYKEEEKAILMAFQEEKDTFRYICTETCSGIRVWFNLVVLS